MTRPNELPARSTDRDEWDDLDSSLIDMDDLCAQIKTVAGDAFHVRVEQTGGGCATLMIFDGAPEYWTTETNQYGNTYERFTGKRALVLAGPGSFDGPNWTEPTALVGEFCYGMDDDGDIRPVGVEEGYDDLEPGQLAREIFHYAEDVHANIQSRWANVPSDRRPYWWNADENKMTWNVLDQTWVTRETPKTPEPDPFAID